MNVLFVYILKCADESYYVGVTNNLNKRVLSHNEDNDIKAYTFSRRPVRLVWSNCFTSNLEAIICEKKIKGWTRKKKEALINSDWNSLKLASECKNETNYKIASPLALREAAISHPERSRRV